METKAICIWPDEMGERNADGSARWIVSRDTLDECGRAKRTATEDVCETRAEALASARDSAREYKLPIYENPENGPSVKLEDAPADDSPGPTDAQLADALLAKFGDGAATPAEIARRIESQLRRETE